MNQNLQSRLSHFLVLLAALAIVLSTGAAIWSVKQNIWSDQGQSLAKYISERGQREETKFDRVATTERLMRKTFFHFRERLSDDEIRDAIEAYFPFAEDGTRRGVDDLWSGTYIQGYGYAHGLGAYMRADNPWTEDRNRDFFAAFLTILQHSASVDPAIESLWFYTPSDDLIIFAPNRPDQLDFYRRSSPPDFSPSTLPLNKVSTLDANPNAETKCTPLTRLAYVDDGEALSTGCQTPVRDGAQQIGVFGTTMPMEEVFRSAVLDLPVPTAELMLVTAEGDLIAHPDFLKSVQLSPSMVNAVADEVGPATLVEELKSQAGNTGIIATEKNALFSGLTGYYHLDIPDWYLIIKIPGKTLVSAAVKQVAPVIGLLMAICLTLISLLVWYIRRFGIRPLHLLAEHFKQDASVSETHYRETNLLQHRQDEIGELARTLQHYKSETEANLQQLEQKVAERTKELELVNEAKSAFLATMSHELRTPMNGILGVAGALRRTGLDSTQGEMIDLIQKSSEVLERQLSDVLDLSKVEAGKLELQKSSRNLADLLNDVCNFHRHAAEAEGLTISLEYDPDCDAYFMLDDVRLKQVLSNLISNSIKFTDTGSIRLEAKALSEKGRDKIFRIRVIDTGRGIDTMDLKQIFSPFVQRNQQTDQRVVGTGLGLTISKSLVELFGGEISATSEEGDGATFTVTLPLTRCESGLDASHTSKIDTSENLEELTAGTRVLLAEDHPVNRRVVQLILEPLGIDVIPVENGKDALQAFEDDKFDLILMDVRMPVMDGLSAVRAIRSLEAEHHLSRTPVLMLSANAMNGHVDDSLAAGADAHIAKPITPERLVNAIKGVLHDENEPDIRPAKQPEHSTQSVQT